MDEEVGVALAKDVRKSGFVPEIVPDSVPVITTPGSSAGVNTAGPVAMAPFCAAVHAIGKPPGAPPTSPDQFPAMLTVVEDGLVD